MNYKKLILCGLLFLNFTVLPAQAEKSPLDGTADARVKSIVYHESDVYKLKGHYGFTTIVEFSPHEKIETISIGDSEAWQIVKPNRPNIMFIKPLAQNADTDMTVLTSKRIYTFQLTSEKAGSAEDQDLTFRLRFAYPDEGGQGIFDYANANDKSSGYADAPSLNAKNLNFNYSFSGSKSLQPLRVFDDGKFTYFQFSSADVTPAVFAVDEKGNESLVNFTTEGEYLVVERVARQFTLRDGDVTTCIFNESYIHPTGKQNGAAPLGTLKPKKTARKKADPNEPPFLAWFKSIAPTGNNTVTYNQ